MCCVVCCVVLCGVVWCCVVLCGVVWCVVWCCVVLCGVVWCCVVLCGVVWCCVVLFGVVWCCVVLGGVGWCWVVLCGVVWWCVGGVCVCVCRVWRVWCVCVCVVCGVWCGRGVTRACLSILVHACIKLKWTSASALFPSAGLTCRHPYACCPKKQVPGVPGGELNQLQGEEKGYEARPPHLPLLRSQEDATFFIALALEALDPARDEHPDQRKTLN